MKAQILTVLLGFAATVCADTINYWRFEEGSGTNVTDETSLANGTLTYFNAWTTDVLGSVIPQTEQPNRYSLDLGIGARVEATPTGYVSLTNFTVEFFFGAQGLPNNHVLDPYEYITVFNTNTYAGFQIGLGQPGNYWDPYAFKIWVGADDGSSSGYINIFGGNFSGWHHLAFVKAGPVGTLYEDGVWLGSGNVPPGPVSLNTNSTFYIGYWNPFDGATPSAKIDEVRISNTALKPWQFLNAYPPRVASFAVNGANALVSFPMILNVLYDIQSTTDLVSGAWSTIAKNVMGNGGIVTNVHVGGATVPQRFYRVGPSGTWMGDDASGYAGWSSGSNGGVGFGSWTLTATGEIGSTSNGFFIGSSTSNGGAAGPGIDTAGKSWGIYANSGNYAAAYRAFATPIPTGGVFRIDMDNGYIDSGQSVGFVLRSGNASSSPGDYNAGARFEFLFLGGTASYAVVDSTGYRPLDIPWTPTGKHLVFTLDTADTYTLLTIDNASGATNTITGTLTGSGSLDSLALYNRNAGSGSDYDAFFNSLQIIAP